jgi:hypothetical protein
MLIGSLSQIDDFEAITSDRIKADLSEFGEIEQVNLLEEKSCAFTNFVSSHFIPLAISRADSDRPVLWADENLKCSEGYRGSQESSGVWQIQDVR